MNNIQERQRQLSEEDEALLALVGVCLLISILMPVVLLLSPEILKEIPLIVAVFGVSLLGPGFTITLKDMRFLLSC